MPRTVEIVGGYQAVVDDEDFDLVSSRRWRIDFKSPSLIYAACFEYVGMVRGRSKYKMIGMHRLIDGAPSDIEVDHRDGNGLNNIRSNLRRCTHAQNMANTKKGRGNSRFKGVCWVNDKKKWVAKTYANGKNYYLGVFDDEVEAAMAYDRKAIELKGEFACVNFPSDGMRSAI